MNEQNNDFGAFLAGFVIGGLVGAATALILAPQSGDEMRAQLAQKSVDLRDMGTERAHQYQERAQTAVSDVRHRAGDASTQAQDQARLVLDKGKQRLGRIFPAVDEMEHWRGAVRAFDEGGAGVPRRG